MTRHGDVTVAVTSGGDPRRSQRLRSAIGTGPGRRLAAGAPAAPARRSPGRAGSVALVGGGPGDPGLITVLGRRLLAEADVVVADRLGPSALLDELDPDVEIVWRARRRARTRMTQDQINALIVDRALAGSRVVRLKGGDPFVFGRGGEEALACVRAGVPFQVVPGRDQRRRRARVRRDPGDAPWHHPGLRGGLRAPGPVAAGRDVDWAALARGPGTLVLLMAVAHLEHDQRRADQARPGRDHAGRGDQGRHDCPASRCSSRRSSTSPQTRRRQRIRPPAVVVIGDVVRLRERLGAGMTGAGTGGSEAAGTDRTTERGAA